MEILHQFGFDIKLFIGQIVNFLILFFIFKRFLFKPIQAIIREREEKIKRGLEDSEKSRLLLEQSTHDGAEILKNTRIEAQNILENARKMSDSVKEDIVAQARAESEKMIAAAKAQAAVEMEKMQKSVKDMSVDLSQKILLNVLQSMFSEDEKAKILKKAVAQIEAEPHGKA
jgi:F-type H+-transporting ATPase subunit b